MRPSDEALERTKQLIAGDIYWLSQNWEHSGAWAKVLEKSTDISQRAYVEVKIMELAPAYWGHQVGDIIKGIKFLPISTIQEAIELVLLPIQ